MIKKIGAITVADALTKIIGYLMLPIYLGLMPKEEFGEFGFLTSALGCVSLVIGLYLYVPLIKNYSAADCESKKQNLVSTIFISLLLWMLLVDVFLVLCKPLLISIYASFFEITTSVDEKFYLAIVVMNTGIATLYCYSLLIARKSTNEIVVFLILKFFVITIFSIVILFANPWSIDSVSNRLIATVAADFVILWGYCFTIFRPYLNFSLDKNLLQTNLKIAIPLIPSAIIGLLVSVIDRRLIAEHHGLSDLANYNLAMQALAPIQMLMSAVQVAWCPHLFSLRDNREAFSKYIWMMLIGFTIMIVVSVVVVFLMYYAVYLEWISNEYNQVPLIIVFASAGAIAGALGHFNNNMFVHLEITKVQMVITFFMLMAYWFLNLLLVPSFSSYGAAISAGISNILALAVGFIFLYNYIGRRK